MINLKLIDQTISAAVVTHCLFFLKGLLEMWLRLLTFSRKIFLGSNLGLLLFFYFHLIRILAENSNFHDYLRKDQRFISHKVPFSISPFPTPSRWRETNTLPACKKVPGSVSKAVTFPMVYVYINQDYYLLKCCQLTHLF